MADVDKTVAVDMGKFRALSDEDKFALVDGVVSQLIEVIDKTRETITSIVKTYSDVTCATGFTAVIGFDFKALSHQKATFAIGHDPVGLIEGLKASINQSEAVNRG